ncbi:MAG: class I SAM-dependent rRNA methyltransferase [Nitrospiraceae bacterium]|nr:MAG: class I SAM-dependent rRNA methyltransferase [Nitrospiraceae bacterium]
MHPHPNPPPSRGRAARNMLTLKVKNQKTGPVINRHPWVFSQALEKIPDNLKPGTPVKLISDRTGYLATGYFNSYSQIAVRLWGYDEQEEINKDFFVRRIQRASDIRRKYVETPETNAYRLINGENDFLPGFIVDKYDRHLVIQCHTRGIEAWKDAIVEALIEAVNPTGIFERSDSSSRKIEGMENNSGLLYGNVPDVVTMKENGFTFLADVKQGQKTGFFLDQRDKRYALMKYARDRSVLNCFCYTGGFSIYALAGGARRVAGVDVSASALELAKENVKLNGLDAGKCEFVRDDVKAYLKNAQTGEFDVIILDPPAFIKDRKKKMEGLVGYRSINEMALRMLPENGILTTCSCSAHLPLLDFRYLLSETGGKAKRSLRFLETYTHGIDHAVLAPFLEGEYLKCFFVML